uniref:Protein kinase domain-containing protein n=1 Tax=Seriola dumerili TaxID=41447 RepID=A0A3B4TGH2_SERDU
VCVCVCVCVCGCVCKWDIIHSDNTHYLIMDFNGEGCFGKVAQCFDLITFEMVAIKIHKDSDDPTIQREVAMLEAVRALDPHKKNILRFMENIMFNNLSCLALEMLDRSLWDLIEERNWEPLSTSEIGPVTHQLLFAFEALKNIGIMHTDLKPVNIMVVNHKDQPFRIKLIDFGLGLPVSKAKVGMIMHLCSEQGFSLQSQLIKKKKKKSYGNCILFHCSATKRSQRIMVSGMVPPAMQHQPHW